MTPNKKLAPVLAGLMLALIASSAVAGEGTRQQEMLDKSRVWTGENGWEIAYIPVPRGTDSFECSLNRDPADANHRLLWTWDGVMMTVAFVGPAPFGTHPGVPTDVSSFAIAVDGRVLFNHPVGYDVVGDFPDLGRQIIIPPMHLSWDINNKEDVGPKTDEILDRLQHGHMLTIKTYGQTYTEDLHGVGSALDFFGKCIQYKEGQD